MIPIFFPAFSQAFFNWIRYCFCPLKCSHVKKALRDFDWTYHIFISQSIYFDKLNFVLYV